MTKAQKDHIEWKLGDYAGQADLYGKNADLTAQIVSTKYNHLLTGWVECLETLGYTVSRKNGYKFTVKERSEK